MKKILKKKIHTKLAVAVVAIFVFGAGAVMAAPGDTIAPLIHLGAGEQQLDSLKVGDTPMTLPSNPELQATTLAGDRVAEFDGQKTTAGNPLSNFLNMYQAYFKTKLNVGTDFDGTSFDWSNPTWTAGGQTETLQSVNVDGNVLSSKLANPTGQNADPVCADAYGRLVKCTGDNTYRWQAHPWGECVYDGGQCSGSFTISEDPVGICEGRYYSGDKSCRGTWTKTFSHLTRRVDWNGNSFPFLRRLIGQNSSGGPLPDESTFVSSANLPSAFANDEEQYLHNLAAPIGPVRQNAGLWRHGVKLSKPGERYHGVLFPVDPDNYGWFNPHKKCQERKLYFVDSNGEWAYFNYKYNYSLGCVLADGNIQKDVIIRTNRKAYIQRAKTFSCGRYGTVDECSTGNANIQSDPDSTGSCSWGSDYNMAPCDSKDSKTECLDQGGPNDSFSGYLYFSNGNSVRVDNMPTRSCVWREFTVSEDRNCNNSFVTSESECLAQNDACTWTPGSTTPSSSRNVLCVNSQGTPVHNSYCDPATKPTTLDPACVQFCIQDQAQQNNTGLLPVGNAAQTIHPACVPSVLNDFGTSLPSLEIKG